MRSNVEHALGMVRVYLLERATQGDENHGVDELARAIAACLGQATESWANDDLSIGKALPKDVLRRAIRFINDNLDSKLKWEEIAADVGLDPFSFGRRFKL